MMVPDPISLAKVGNDREIAFKYKPGLACAGAGNSTFARMD
jgi:hypothetical protein